MNTDYATKGCIGFGSMSLNGTRISPHTEHAPVYIMTFYNHDIVIREYCAECKRNWHTIDLALDKLNTT